MKFPLNRKISKDINK